MADPPGPQAKPVSILFVCLGNICRSPMAEGTFRTLTNFGTPEQHPLIANIDSCGTGAYHAGDQPDTRTMSVLEQNGLTGYRHKARKVRVPQDFEEFDYVIGMDGDNVEDLKAMAKRNGVEGKVHLYGVYGGKSAREEVEDPYYGGRNGFVVAYEQVTRLGEGLLRHIGEQAKLQEAAAS